jgi:hypothetical protein
MNRRQIWAGIIVIVAIVVIIAVLIAFVRITTISDSSNGYSNSTIDPGQYVAESKEMYPGTHYYTTISSAGGPVDVIVLNASGYDSYTSTLKGSQKAWTAYQTVKNVTSAEVDFTPPQTLTYYVVIDNSPLVEGGADGDSKVTVNSSTSYRWNERHILSIAGLPLLSW